MPLADIHAHPGYGSGSQRAKSITSVLGADALSAGLLHASMHADGSASAVT
jgi:hypothetical protein